VQSALVKEVVKHRSNKRRQLELLYDFSTSTQGQHQVIRKLCDELNIIELPEKGMKIGELDYAWDDHVHDIATSGRKNPTQLVIDAFIKGISRLRVAYGSTSDIEMMEEAIEAGNILGIKVDIGLEFSAMVEGAHYHFMAELPHLATKEEVRQFLALHENDLGEFFHGLDINRGKRLDAVRSLLDNFNRDILPGINKGFELKPEYCLAPLSLDELLATIPNVNITPLHLAEFLYMRYRPVLQKRVWYYKVLREKVRYDEGAPDKKTIETTYETLKKELNRLSPDTLLSEYFDSPHAISYQTVFDDIAVLSTKLRNAGCSVKFVIPLEHGVEKAKAVVQEWGSFLDAIEIYNTQDCVSRKTEEVESFARFINQRNIAARAVAQSHGQAGGQSSLQPSCGSDATGRNPKIPGMGFIFEDQITGKLRQKYLKRHIKLPPLVSAMIRAANEPIDETSLQDKDLPCIVSMGKISGIEAFPYTSDDERIGLRRAWRYLNPTFKNTVRTLVGLGIATPFIGFGYALLWIGITAVRNSIVDLISYRGPKLNAWKLKSINFDNVAQSLFWTGLSVPLLGFVKTNFDVLWAGSHSGFLYNLLSFFFISFVNGIYLVSHNILRGFDKSVIRANFFRNVIAWPFATVFAPVGNLLFIPTIVQSKIWGDIVGGFIEGGNKYRKVLRQRQKTLEEVIPTVINARGSTQFTAMLDLLYLFSQEPRTRTTIKAILSPYAFFTHKLKENSSLRLTTLIELYETMSHETLWTDLVDYIVANYDEDMADDLVDLVVDGLPLLLDDLGKLIEKYKKDPGLMARFASRTNALRHAKKED